MRTWLIDNGHIISYLQASLPCGLRGLNMQHLKVGEENGALYKLNCNGPGILVR